MKLRIIALICALSATALASPKDKSAKDPDPQTKKVDNTKVNERDRSSAAVTPMNQGNSASEIKISADIRKEIMNDKTLSFTAQNVKIVTVGTKVTLRGPVKSVQERSTIERIAKQAAGVGEIDNQLEVKN